MKRTVVTTLCIIILMMMCYPTFAASKEKTIKTKLQNNVTLEYTGAVENKLPLGDGTINLIKSDAIVDQIRGTFNNHTINEATMVFKEGKVFKGDIDYSTTDQDIIYNLTKGYFEVQLKNEKDPLYIPLTTALPIHRRFSDLKMSSEVPLKIEFPKTEVVQTVPIDNIYEGFIGVPQEIKKVDYYIYNLEGGSILGSPDGKDANYYDINFGDKGTGKYYYNKWLLEINCPNGDYLKKEDRENHSFDLKRHVEGGIIETHLIYGKNFIFKYPWETQNKNSELADKFYENMPKEFSTLKDSMRTMSIDHRLYLLYEIGEITYDEVRDNSMEIAIEAKYDNGDYYMGSIYYPTDKGSLNDIVSMTIMPQEKDYFTGVLTTKEGDRQYYIEGYPAATLREIMDIYVENRIEENERFERERDEKIAAQEKANKERREYLTKQYGKKYVDAMLDQYTILVGTPEGLLKDTQFCSVYIETERSITYKVGVINTRFIVTVDKKTHCVTSVIDMR